MSLNVSSVLLIAVLILFAQYVSEIRKVEAAKDAGEGTWAHQLTVGVKNATVSGFNWSYDKVNGFISNIGKGKAEELPTTESDFDSEIKVEVPQTDFIEEKESVPTDEFPRKQDLDI